MKFETEKFKPTKLSLVELSLRSKKFYELIRKRRSIREFDKTPIKDEIIKNAILSAGSAPNGANLQPWHFVIIKNKKIKKAIRKAAEKEEKKFYNKVAPTEWLKALEPLGTDENKEFLGWILPGIKKYSLSNTFLSKLISNKKSILTTKKNGSVRTIIPMGNWDNVLPMDILPEFLVKNILVNDVEMMEKLGIYECSPEDFALCSFICQSKVEVSKIIEEGLDMMEQEG